MKINNLPGDYAFKALLHRKWGSEERTFYSWEITSQVFLTLEEAQAFCGDDCRWPIEIWDDGTVHIVGKEELE